jgi:hypothetical protein
MSLKRFEPKISESERPQTYALDCAATGTGMVIDYVIILAIIYCYLLLHRSGNVTFDVRKVKHIS